MDPSDRLLLRTEDRPEVSLHWDRDRPVSARRGDTVSLALLGSAIGPRGGRDRWLVMGLMLLLAPFTIAKTASTGMAARNSMPLLSTSRATQMVRGMVVERTSFASRVKATVDGARGTDSLAIPAGTTVEVVYSW